VAYDDGLRTLVVSVAAIGVLLLVLLVLRAERTTPLPPTRAAWSAQPTGRAFWLGLLAVVAAGAPLLHLAPWWHTQAAFGDAVTHARVGGDLAASGLPHGWIDSYLGGFPFAVHYPPAGWSILAALVTLGLSPLDATHTLGWLAIASTPLAFYVGLSRCGAHPGFAAIGALCVSWVAPYNGFVGGYESFFMLGLLSQVIALPVCILLMSFVARAQTAGPAALCAALAMLAHPQLAIATFVVLAVACIVAADRDALERCARSGLAALAVGLAIYGPGVATLHVPFGWPSDLGWRHLGFQPTRLEWWLRDGSLLDAWRPVVLTDLAGAAALVLLFFPRRGVARAAVVAAVLTVALSVSGHALRSLGPLGATALSVLQPLRALALVPIAAGVLVAAALEEAAPRIERMVELRSPGRGRYAALATIAALFALLLLALPDRIAYARALGEDLATSAAHPCGERTPEGYDREVVHGWMRGLSGGRLWFTEAEPAVLRCVYDDGLQISSAVPIAATVAVGAHVGLHWSAFAELELRRPGSDRRAEALGVRHALTLQGTDPPGWRRTAAQGALELWTHDRPTTLVGAGCVHETWRGGDAALRERLLARLEDPEGVDTLLSPDRLVALEHAEGPVEIVRPDLAGCDASAVVIDETPREPGALEATVTSPAPVDVVLRVTAYPTWQVHVDGARLGPLRQVAPGFLSVRLPPGRHHLVATAGWLPGQGLWLILGAVAAVLAATARRTWLPTWRPRDAHVAR
jgi:hypothetical protein